MTTANEAALEGLRQHLAALHHTFVGTEGFTFESLEMEHSALHAPGQIHEHTYPRPEAHEETTVA